MPDHDGEVRRIKDCLDYEAFYGSELGGMHGSGAELEAFCPFHENTDTPALGVNVGNGLYICRNPECGARGDVFTFYRRKHDCDFPTAKRELAEFAGIQLSENGPPPPAATPPPPAAEVPAIDEAIVEAASHTLQHHPEKLAYLTEERGFTDETIRQYKIGFYRGRYTIPIRDVEGRLVNIRSYAPNAREAKMISWRRGRGEARLWPLPLTEDGLVLFAEGEWDCLLARQNDLNAVTTTAGAGTWKDEWAEQFRDRDVVICFDCDAAGRIGARRIAAKLSVIAARVRILDLNPERNDGHDISDFFAEGGLADELRERIEAAPAFEPDEPFELTTGGKPLSNSQRNVRLALDRLAAKLSYDEFADQLLVSRGGGSPAPISDAILDRLWLEIDEQFSFRPSAGFYRTVVADYARQHTFHPVVDYLVSLEWDGTPRLDTWLATYGGAVDSEYVRAVGAITLIAAVRRVRTPGVKFDEMMVLESPQGKNKSRAILTLAGFDAWFCDDLPLGVSAQKVIEQTVGKWIIEAAELSGMQRKEVETLKAFLSRQSDRSRLAYRRVTEERPRHFVVIGTTNSDRYLKDSTGNRRFWPVQVGTFDITTLRRDRDQLWAEAVHREANGESIRLDQSLWGAAEREQEERVADDPWETRLRDMLGEADGKILGEDVWSLVGKENAGHRQQYDNDRLGAVMRRLGFERKRMRFDVDGLKYGYFRHSEDGRLRLLKDDRGSVTGVDFPVPF